MPLLLKAGTPGNGILFRLPASTREVRRTWSLIIFHGTPRQEISGKPHPPYLHSFNFISAATFIQMAHRMFVLPRAYQTAGSYFFPTIISGRAAIYFPAFFIPKTSHR